MPNTSATGGYLRPTTPTPIDDKALGLFINAMIVGLTGVDENLVREAFQPNPPKRPNIDVNWVAFYTTNEQAELGNAYVEVAKDGLSSKQIRHETFDIRVTVYGPQAKAIAKILRDGLEIPQNREQLFLNGMAYVDCSSIISIGELNNEQWYKRSDLTLTMRRELNRTYGVLSFVAANGTIITETMTIPWAVGPEA